MDVDTDPVFSTGTTFELNIGVISTAACNSLLSDAAVPAAELRRSRSHHLSAGRIKDDYIPAAILIADIDLENARSVDGKRIVIGNSVQTVGSVCPAGRIHNDHAASVESSTLIEVSGCCAARGIGQAAINYSIELKILSELRHDLTAVYTQFSRNLSM